MEEVIGSMAGQVPLRCVQWAGHTPCRLASQQLASWPLPSALVGRLNPHAASSVVRLM